MKQLLGLAALFLFSISLFAQGTAEDYDRAARLYSRTMNKVSRTSVRPNWFDGNKRFWYRVDLGAGAREFVVVDVEAGKREPAFDHAKLAEDLSKATGRKLRATHLPLENLRFEQEAKAVTFRAQGKTWRVVRSTGALIEAKADAKEKETPVSLQPRRPIRYSSSSSPDARRQVVFRDHNAYMVDRVKKTEVPMTKDGTEKDSYGGRAYWSPDSKKVVVLKTKAGQNRQIYLLESSPKGQTSGKLHTLNYAKPGDVMPITKPHLFEAETNKEIPIKDDLFSNPWRLDQIRWAADSSRFTFDYNQRGHQILRVVAVDGNTGEAKAIVDEVSKTFIDYAGKHYLRWVGENELIWMSERDGWNHLYLYDAKTGKVKNPITKGNWVVRAVDRVDEKARQVWFQAGGIHPNQDPYYVHFCRVNFDGTGLVVLTEGDGTHEVTYSPDGKYLLDTYSRVDMAPVTELRRVSDGKFVCQLEKGDLSALLATGWKLPERFVAKGRDGKTDIYGVIFRPTNFDPKKTYPIIEEIYAGPHSAFVPKRFRSYYGQQAMAELGFIVVKMDGMGTSHRSKAFHDVCWKNLGDSGFPDRIAWIKAAAKKYPYMDLTRIGIYGGSAGGQSSTRAMLAHGDFYKVAVSDCGCHDNRVDKIWWNELWMGWPIGPHYAEQSNVTNAHKLKGKLLLVVGEMDRNVDPVSTLQVVNALIKANKDFDLLFIPGAGHGAAESPYGRRRRQDFFVRNLLGVEPRRSAKEVGGQ